MVPRHGDWMQTHSGRAYYPHDPRPEDIYIDDLAHHLSMLCRFTGAVSRFYSVAEHCIHVSKIVPAEHSLVGLLHDAPEAYLNDLNRPLKVGLPGYKRIEEINWLAMCEKFDLPLVMDPCIKEADELVYFIEQRALMPMNERIKTPPNLPDVGMIGWPQAVAKQRFYDRYMEIING